MLSSKRGEIDKRAEELAKQLTENQDSGFFEDPEILSDVIIDQLIKEYGRTSIEELVEVACDVAWAVWDEKGWK